jgi:hypothetical protein
MFLQSYFYAKMHSLFTALEEQLELVQKIVCNLQLSLKQYSIPSSFAEPRQEPEPQEAAPFLLLEPEPHQNVHILFCTI